MSGPISSGGRTCGGSNSCCFWINGASNVTIDGRGQRIDTGTSAFRVEGNSSNILIKNVKSSDGINIYGASVSGMTVQDSELESVDGYDADDLTVQRNHLQQMTFDAISGGAFRLHIYDNVIYQTADPSDARHYCASCAADPLNFAPHTVHLDSKNANADHFIVGDWEIKRNYIKSGTPIEEVTASMSSTPSFVSAITIRDTKNVVFTDNIVESAAGFGIYLRDYDQDSTYSNNIFRTTKRAAIHVGSGSFSDTVSNNTFSENTFQTDRDWPMAIENFGTGNLFTNNSIVSGGPSCSGYVLIGGRASTFQNNTFIALSTSPAVCRTSGGSSTDTFKNNIFSFLGTQAISGTSNYSGINNVFNSRNSQTPIHPASESSPTDLPGSIFQSIDLASANFVRLNSNSSACTAGQGGAYTGRYSCSGGGADTQSPTAPSGLTAIPVSSSQINLTWMAATDNVGVTGYNIYRNGGLIGSSITTGYTDKTGLSPSTTYTYFVKALDANGNISIASNDASTATLGVSSVSDTQPPTSPTGVVATAKSPSEIDVTWNASTDNIAVVAYEVYANGSLVGTVSTLMFSSTGLLADTSYNFSVVAIDSSGNASTPAFANAVTTSRSLSSSDGPGVISPQGDATLAVSTGCAASPSQSLMLYFVISLFAISNIRKRSCSAESRNHEERQARSR